MKKNKILCVLLTAMLAVSMSSCGDTQTVSTETDGESDIQTEEIQQETTENTEETTDSAETTTAAEETESVDDLSGGVITIGEPDDSEDTFEVMLKNSTGKDILGFSVKSDAEDSFPENMLGSNVLDNGKSIHLYYKKPAAETPVQTGDVPLITTEYLIKIVFGDGVYELHQFPFGDIESGEICFEDDVAFITYTSVANNISVSTKSAEVMIKNTPVQETEEAPISAPEESTPEVSVPEESVAPEVSYYEEPVYSEPVESYVESYYEEPVYSEPVYEEPVYEEPAYQQIPNETPVDPNNGCIGGGGLFN